MVDLRINETCQTGAVRRPPLPFSRLVGTVSNSADVVRPMHREGNLPSSRQNRSKKWETKCPTFGYSYLLYFYHYVKI